MILPPATLGMLGGGQLGRFFVSAAHEMGYKVWVLDPDPHSPAGLIADRHLVAAYDDYVALVSYIRAQPPVDGELPPDEQARFRDAARPVRDEYLELAGPRGAELLDRIEGAVRRARAATPDDDTPSDP